MESFLRRAGLTWEMLLNGYIAICFKHFVLIDEGSVDIVVACLRMCTDSKGETHL